MFSKKLSHTHILFGFLGLSIFILVGYIVLGKDVVFAEDVSAVGTLSTTNTIILPELPVPSNFEVLREGETTLVLFDAVSSSNVVGYKIYRRCTDTAWWFVAKVATVDCDGACSFTVLDKKTGDTCGYSVRSLDSAGRESAGSVEKTPIGSVETPVVPPTTSTAVNPLPTPSITSTTTPTAQIVISGGKDFKVVFGKYLLSLRVEGVVLESVEWSIYPQGSNTPTYLGKSVYDSKDGFWKYKWDSSTVPNGDYNLVPKIVSPTGGRFEDEPMRVHVKNDNVFPKPLTDQGLVDTIKEAAGEVVKVTGSNDTVAKKDVADVLTPYAEKIQKHIEDEGSDAVKQELRDEAKKAEEQMRVLLNIESSKLLRALNGDEEEFKRFRNRILIAAQGSMDNIDKVAKEFGIELSDDDRKELEKEIIAQLGELEGVIKERKKVLQERVGDKVFEDSDNDGVSNYDEVNIYKTNPFSSDSDNDGFFDGAEILSGFNPNNPAVEAIVEYEEPRTEGFVEDAVFSVDQIAVSGTTKNEEGKDDASKFTLQGKAPANSFVTVYVYSTPVIVKAKTDANGYWRYELDKGLEDGNHEVYVAITDNAGKIYAKSKPLPFVKEATAVTVDQNALFTGTGDDGSPNIFSNKYFYIFAFLIIAIIGWVLVFTGGKHAHADVPNM